MIDGKRIFNCLIRVMIEIEYKNFKKQFNMLFQIRMNQNWIQFIRNMQNPTPLKSNLPQHRTPSASSNRVQVSTVHINSFGRSNNTPWQQKASENIQPQTHRKPSSQQLIPFEEEAPACKLRGSYIQFQHDGKSLIEELDDQQCQKCKALQLRVKELQQELAEEKKRELLAAIDKPSTPDQIAFEKVSINQAESFEDILGSHYTKNSALYAPLISCKKANDKSDNFSEHKSELFEKSPLANSRSFIQEDKKQNRLQSPPRMAVSIMSGSSAKTPPPYQSVILKDQKTPVKETPVQETPDKQSLDFSPGLLCSSPAKPDNQYPLQSSVELQTSFVLSNHEDTIQPSHQQLQEKLHSQMQKRIALQAQLQKLKKTQSQLKQIKQIKQLVDQQIQDSEARIKLRKLRKFSDLPQKLPFQNIIVQIQKQPLSSQASVHHIARLYCQIRNQTLRQVNFDSFLIKVLLKCHHFHIMFIKQNPNCTINEDIYRFFRQFENQIQKMELKSDQQWEKMKEFRRNTEQILRKYIQQIYWKTKASINVLFQKPKAICFKKVAKSQI